MSDELKRRIEQSAKAAAVIDNPVVAADSIEQYTNKLIELGCCPYCLEVPEMDVEEPISICCSQGEDYAKRPLQRLQMLERKIGGQLEELEALLSVPQSRDDLMCFYMAQSVLEDLKEDENE